MSTNPEEVIDDIAAKLEQSRQAVIEDDPVLNGAEEILDDRTDDKEVINEKPPGFMDYDEWIAKGKDPADFRGENAYKKQYEALTEVRELKSTVEQVSESMKEWKASETARMQQQLERDRAAITAKLEQAREEADIEAFASATDELNNLNASPPPTPTPQINPVVSKFLESNPIIDSASLKFNKDFFDDVKMIQNGYLDKLLGGDRSRVGELTPRQVENALKTAYEDAKALNKDLFVSPRNNRPTTTTTPRRETTPTSDYRTKLKAIGGNEKNHFDSNPAVDMYDLLMSKGEKGKKAAETYAKNVLGE